MAGKTIVVRLSGDFVERILSVAKMKRSTVPDVIEIIIDQGLSEIEISDRLNNIRNVAEIEARNG